MEKILKKLPFYDHTWFSFLRFLVRHFLEDNCQQKAASLTYTTLLSIVPILTVLLMILSSVPALESVREQISQVIYSNLLPQSSLQVSQYLNNFAEKSSNLTAIGAMVLFVTTIMTLTTIERAFNQIWRVEERSGGLKSILRYWTIITLGPLVLGTAFIASSAVQSLSFLNKQVAGYGIDWSFWVQVISFAVTIAGFIGMYWFIPKARVPVKTAAIAGIFVAVVFELLRNVFGLVMSNFTSYEAIYGAFAAFPILLLWIYMSWNLILLGVEISYTLTIFASGEVTPRHPLISLLDMLNLLHERYQQGQCAKEQELRDVLGRKELPKWFTYLNYLKQCDLITVTADGEYVLKKDLQSLTLWDFYRTLPYPLPIKHELDDIKLNATQPGLQQLLQRLEHTENYVRQELNIPLADIFNQSHPIGDNRSLFSVDNTQAKPVDKDSDRSQYSTEQSLAAKIFGTKESKTNKETVVKDSVPPIAEPYDPTEEVVTDNNEKEAIIPSDADLNSKHQEATDNTATTKKEINDTKKTRLLGGILSHHAKHKPVITEEDNPEKSND